MRNLLYAVVLVGLAALVQRVDLRGSWPFAVLFSVLFTGTLTAEWLLAMRGPAAWRGARSSRG